MTVLFDVSHTPGLKWDTSRIGLLILCWSHSNVAIQYNQCVGDRNSVSDIQRYDFTIKALEWNRFDVFVCDRCLADVSKPLVRNRRQRSLIYASDDWTGRHRSRRTVSTVDLRIDHIDTQFTLFFDGLAYIGFSVQTLLSKPTEVWSTRMGDHRGKPHSLVAVFASDNYDLQIAIYSCVVMFIF